MHQARFGCLEVTCWHFVPKIPSLHPAEAVGSLGRKIFQRAFGRDVKPSVPCCSFTACKISLNGVEVVISAKLQDISRHSSTFRRWVLSRGDTRGDAWWRKLESLTKIAQ
jgi:hypothetical protein